ncbi:MAG: AAA family ATPase [Devosia sp.]|uniref:AAA family ATPase n=1 Tax=Devosia sp. TaxID=1871048 RepID=UPI001A4D0C60|nr:AAA family ATPase [Devosia sp.]MBL8599937.1 AAA family ATPase [Devosia sp.]
MLRLDAIQLENFGPYKGRQRIDFPRDDGVVIIYGENMRGKTTLLNALRFAFFGKFFGRGSKAIEVSKIGNQEAAEAGDYGFEVRLEMKHDGVPYRLTRSCRPIIPGTLPTSDEDLKVDYFLERDGAILSPQEAGRELQRILPEEISRFFLFDAELLQEYEDLLVGDSAVGDRIAAAIERILGLPHLTRARDSLAQAKDRAAKLEASAAQGNQRTKELGSLLSQLVAAREALNNDLERQGVELAAIRQEKTFLEERMRKNERTATLMDSKDRLEREKANLAEKLEMDRVRVKDEMGMAWTVVLAPRIRETLVELKREDASLQASVTRSKLLSQIADDHVTHCPLCAQRIGHDARQHLAELLRDRDPDMGKSMERLAEISSQIAALEKHERAANPQVLRLLLEGLAETERAIHSRSEELKDLKAKLEDIDEEGVRQIRHDYERVIKELNVLEMGLERTQAALLKNEADRQNIQNKLAKIGGGGLDTAREHFQIANDLFDLMNAAVGEFREKLRVRVEADATRHFRTLTTEPEFTDLRINDSYGLTIIHKSGQQVSIRSAGAEHIVALSLVAALQNNAPLRGPIIIDSPFVRLDGGHKDNIMQALPTLASQVVLLVYEDEMAPERARRALKGNLKAEFKLVRRSARHTVLTAKDGSL